MPIGFGAALGSLTSLTGGGALQPSTPTTATSDSVTGAVNVGGLNVPALPNQTNLLIIGGLVLGGLFLFTRRKP